MSVHEDITALVEQRVAEQLLPRVLEGLEQSHAKHGHTQDCRCEYCELKRTATHDIGYIKPHLRGKGVRGSCIIGTTHELFDLATAEGYKSYIRNMQALHDDPAVQEVSTCVTSRGMEVTTYRKALPEDEEYFRVKAVREALINAYRVRLSKAKTR